MDRITALNKVEEQYRAFVRMQHGKDKTTDAKMAINNLHDGEILQIRPERGGGNAKGTD